MGLLAKLIDLLLQALKIVKRFGPAARVAQQRRGVVDGHHLKAVLFKPLAVLARDLEVGLDEAHGRDAPEADDDLRPQQRDLAAQIADAGILLHAQRVAVFRRAALDDIGDLHVLALETDDLEHIVEQMTGPADERHALRVLVRAGTLADE